jgi:hypothetical protein
MRKIIILLFQILNALFNVLALKMQSVKTIKNVVCVISAHTLSFPEIDKREKKLCLETLMFQTQFWRQS